MEDILKIMLGGYEFEKMDLYEFLVSETWGDRYVCISKILPETHEDFIYTIYKSEVESKQKLIEALKPDDRFIFVHSENMEADLILKMYKNKTQLKPKEHFALKAITKNLIRLELEMNEQYQEELNEDFGTDTQAY